MTLHSLLAASFGILLAAGCAHAPGDQAGLKHTRPQTAVVTGSRLAQRVDASSGVPATIGPARIYTRQQLSQTGRSYDTAAALRDLDPSITVGGQSIRK